MKYAKAQALALCSAALSIGSVARAADSPQSIDLAQVNTPISPSNAVTADAPPATYLPAPTVDIGSYFSHWFDRVNQAQASQPHWMTPLVTVTPRLEEEVRYDQYWEHLGTGASLDNYDAGKGLELIPTTTNEILLNPPPYEERYNKKPASGFADDPFLTIKQRLLSANEENGNYILTTFLGFQAPTGSTVFGGNEWLITPTIAGGKGWGDFDIQATFGVPTPIGPSAKTTGVSLVTNVTFQYHLATYFWPEFEANDTYWASGERSGKNQLFLTPGLILGRFQLYNRLRLSVGAGYQFAVSPKLVTQPALTPIYNHAWILSVRASF